jgi:hypothetical protein
MQNKTYLTFISLVLSVSYGCYESVHVSYMLYLVTYVYMYYVTCQVYKYRRGGGVLPNHETLNSFFYLGTRA